MKIRTALAGFAIAGTLAAGFTGVADARTPAPSTKTTHSLSCDTAKDRLAKVHTRVEALKDRIAKLAARIDQLRKEGHGDRVDVLAKRLEKAKDELAKLEARFDVLTKRIHERCADPKAVTPAA
jgi:predicted  nucleic acid-binding Zn-ribbon protein